LSKTFTLSEAQTLIPVLDALLRRAREAALRTASIDSEMQELNRRIFLSGGLHVDVPAAARRRAQRDKSAEQATAILEEIEEIGAQVQDLEEGVLELPCALDGRTVLLCWTLGDAEIAAWRETTDGEEVRRVLDGRFGHSHRDRDRPN